VRILGDAIYHVHMKDSKVDPLNVSRVSVLDTKPYTEEINRDGSSAPSATAMTNLFGATSSPTFGSWGTTACSLSNTKTA
jgi:hypothetical protein